MKISPMWLSRLFGGLTSTFFVGSCGRVLTQLVAFATILLVSRYLSLEEFGVFALSSACSIIIVSLIYAGPFEYLLRTRELDSDRDTVFWLLAAAGAVGALVMASIGAALDESKPGIGQFFLLLALMPLLTGPRVWAEALLTRAGRIRSTVLCNLGAEICGILSLFVALEAGQGVLALVTSRLAATAVALAGQSVLMGKRPRLHFSRESAVNAFDHVMPLSGVAAIKLVSNYGVDLLLGAFLAPAAVGAYRAGSRVATTGCDIVLRPMHAISWSYFARLERDGDKAVMARIWKQQMRFLSAVAWPALAVLAMSGPLVVSLLLSDSWAGAGPIISILTIARALEVLDFLAGPVLVCSGSAHAMVKLRAGGAVCLLLMLLAVAHYGAEYAAGAQVLANAGVALAALTLISRSLQLSVLTIMKAVVPGLLLAVSCAIAIFAIQEATATITLAGPWAAISGAILLWGVLFLTLLSRGTLRLPEP